MNDFYIIKYILFSVIISLNINVTFERDIAMIYLLAMTEKMKEARDNNKVCTAVLTDLSKAFDCLFHDLIIAKLYAFGFDFKSSRIIHAYLSDRIQVTKVCSFYSKILQIINGFPQGSILGPLLFNVNFNRLFPRGAL